MSCNVVNEYVSFSKKAIKKYLQLTLDKNFDLDIYDDLINAYINTRYYNLYEPVNKNFEINIVYYLKKSLEHVKDEKRYKNKSSIMFQMFKYILYFDNVLECESALSLIDEVVKFREETVGIKEPDFKEKLYSLLKSDLTAKTEFIEGLSDKNFSVNYIKLNSDQLFDCKLEHNLKFPKLYSEYAINKVFDNKEIREQRLFVLYSLVTVKILCDIIKGNFKKTYFVDYSINLKDKPKKKKRLLNIINNDIVKEKLSLKVNYHEYIENKEEVYDLTRNAYSVAIVLDKNVEVTEQLCQLLTIFSYVLTDDVNIYEKLKNKYTVLYINS